MASTFTVKPLDKGGYGVYHNGELITHVDSEEQGKEYIARLTKTTKGGLTMATEKTARDKAREQGYEGGSPSIVPNEKFALTTGPDSPSAAEQIAAVAEQRAKEVRATVGGGA